MLIVPLQLNFTMVIEVLFKLLMIMSKRTKHIEIDCHFICHHLLQGALTLQSVSSQNQLADIFTKPLPLRTFQALTFKLIIVSLKPP